MNLQREVGFEVVIHSILIITKLHSMQKCLCYIEYSLQACIGYMLISLKKAFRFTSLCSGIRCIRIRYISIRYIWISCIRVYYNSCLQEMTTLETRRAMSRQIRGLRMHTLGPGFPLISLVWQSMSVPPYCLVWIEWSLLLWLQIK